MTTSEPKRWFVLYVEPILDQYAKTYQNRITLDGIPAGPLGEKVRRIHTPRLSEFRPYDDTGRCVYALLRDIVGAGTYMMEEDVPELLAYLWANGYDFDYKATGLIDSRDNRKPITVAIYKER